MARPLNRMYKSPLVDWYKYRRSRIMQAQTTLGTTDSASMHPHNNRSDQTYCLDESKSSEYQ